MNVHHGKERGNGKVMLKVPILHTLWSLGRTNLSSRIRRMSKMGKILFGQQTDTTGVAEMNQATNDFGEIKPNMLTVVRAVLVLLPSYRTSGMQGNQFLRSMRLVI